MEKVVQERLNRRYNKDIIYVIGCVKGVFFLRGLSMDRQQIALKLTVEGLGLTFEIDTFKKRLILQKAVYLAQEIGVRLGYYYQWYLYGPYCPSLARDGYSISEELIKDVDESKGWILDKASQNRLDRLKKLIIESEEEDRSRKLELLASVHFLLKRRQVQDKNTAEITAILKKFGKDFTEREVEDAMRELDKYELLAG